MNKKLEAGKEICRQELPREGSRHPGGSRRIMLREEGGGSVPPRETGRREMCKCASLVIYKNQLLANV